MTLSLPLCRWGFIGNLKTPWTRLFRYFDFSILKLERKTIKMNSDHCSDLELDKRSLPIPHDHLMSPYHEPEASGLQVASLAQPNQKQSLPNMPASKINILAESRTRGCSCHGRNRYQRCRLSRQMEIWSQRKVRNAVLNVTLYPALLMAFKQVDTISKPTIHLGRICWTSFPHPRVHPLEETGLQLLQL